MVYAVKAPVLGFENMHSVVVTSIDESVEGVNAKDLIIKISDEANSSISMLLISPYALREYSFDLPTSVQVLMDITDTSNIKIYCPVVEAKPITESKVNFLAPFVFNEDNKTVSQVVLQAKDYPNFGVAEDLKDYLSK